MNPKIHDLLNHVQTLQMYEEILTHTQSDRFNIFDILNIGSMEVGTHSPYLAEFLNPKGNHGLGHRPLEAFAHSFNLRIDPTSTEVHPEYPLGPVTAESGGYVDILLRDKDGNEVVIENKLFAADQPNQLTRYQNGLPQAQIIYLTLNGRKPSDKTTASPERIISLSYGKDIIQWQEECHRMAAPMPLVRETITQYINLLKRLTNQSTNKRMSEQIIKSLLSNEQNLKAYYELIHTQTAVETAIIKKLNDQCDNIAKSLKLDFKFTSGSFDKKHAGFHFFDDSMLRQNICISFQFEESNNKSLLFGIAYNDSKKARLDHPQIATIQEKFKSIFQSVETETEWWPASLYWKSKSRHNWTEETFIDIAFGRFQSELKDKIEKLLSIVRYFQEQS